MEFHHAHEDICSDEAENPRSEESGASSRFRSASPDSAYRRLRERSPETREGRSGIIGDIRQLSGADREGEGSEGEAEASSPAIDRLSATDEDGSEAGSEAAAEQPAAAEPGGRRKQPAPQYDWFLTSWFERETRPGSGVFRSTLPPSVDDRRIRESISSGGLVSGVRCVLLHSLWFLCSSLCYGMGLPFPERS